MSLGSFSPPPPPVFVGENYHIWVVKMKTYLLAFDLWEVIDVDREPPPLKANPTIAQMRQYSEECAKKHKAMSCLQNGVSDVIFTRIMACETPKQCSDNRIVEKVITTLPERYESKISSLEYSRDLSTISLSKLINALYAQEQRTTSRQEEHSEGAFQSRSKEGSSSSSKKGKKSWSESKEKQMRDNGKEKYPSCSHCKKNTHLKKY
ncbi:uncharacterized protein LOC128039744 [Gossypium raimondii]|uniref:uncharacterized protein LOC128039744 n=1 Tax=Gossypium raimondii TaxID=29730 RepID=UPI00227A3ED5|nr:uncharacterized protein LOC128039744 [Gossypium raimondii]XP_052484025.1 uncharacterized protein LOC128039744 [Gossypium raimondii]XP_052484026.1 uncharacterized protein LOC128039744 [Gossypium raimondii]